MDQDIRFCTIPTGVRIAYATIGQGPPLVVPPYWVTHLEVDWEQPALRAFWTTLAQHHTILRFDTHGCGLSDRDRDRTDRTLDYEVRMLEAVLDQLALGTSD